MSKQFERLRLKIRQLEELSDELEKLISKRTGLNNKHWLLALEKSRLDIAEIKSVVESIPNKYNDLLEKEKLIRDKGSLIKLEKIEKEKKKFLESIDGLLKICEILEDNLRTTLSQI